MKLYFRCASIALALAPVAAASKDAAPIDLSLAGEYPSEFDKLAREYLKENLKDPMSAIIEMTRAPRREVWQSGAFNHKKTPIWVACYEVNAKNSYGGYTGSETYIFMFQNNLLMKTVSDADFPARDISAACARPADPKPTSTAAKPG